MEEYFQSEGCRLIEKNGNRVTYVAQCGHEHTSLIGNFKKGSSRVCKQCTIQQQRENETDFFEQEGECFVHISKLLEPHLEVKRTNEGCIADFIYRPWSAKENEWVQVQMKSTLKKIHGSFRFRLNHRFPGCILVCHCIEENRFWVFRDYEVPEKSIGICESGKYAHNEVNNVSESLIRLYETMMKTTLESAMIPSSPNHRKEYEYRLKRERFFPDVQFEYPLYQQRRYDFIVNGKKYQEKVATPKENRYIIKSSYELGDNDFYFVHIPDSDYFYCIPEQQFIPNQTSSGCMTFNISDHKKWFQVYRHNYTIRSFSF